MTEAQTIRIYLSYAPEDEDLKKEFVTMMAPLVHQPGVELIDEGGQLAGTQAESFLMNAVLKADIYLPLISSSFIAHQELYGRKTPLFFRRHERGELTVFPVLIRPAMMEYTVFKGLVRLPRPEGSPSVEERSGRGAVWLEIVRELDAVIRHRRANPRPNPPITKILFLAANPQNTTPLDLEGELSGIQTALDQAFFKGAFSLVFRAETTAEALQDTIRRERPQIIHFSGHGSNAGEILLESEGSFHPVSPEALASLLRIDEVKDFTQMLFFNACFSGVAAEPLAALGKPMIMMNDAVYDQDAIRLAEGFYKALFDGAKFDVAYCYGMANVEIGRGASGASSGGLFFESAYQQAGRLPPEWWAEGHIVESPCVG